MNGTVVLYPAVEMGHLIPMIEMGKTLVRHGLSVALLLHHHLHHLQQSNKSPIDTWLAGANASSISVHQLPPLPLPQDPNSVPAISDFRMQSNPDLVLFLRSFPSPVLALIPDFFTAGAMDVALELHLPCYVFSPISASCLAAFLHLPSQFLRPFPASDMPLLLSDPSDEGCQKLLFLFQRIPAARGLLINTFRSLEPSAIQALSGSLPSVYCVGPVSSVGGSGGGSAAWLDGQAEGSVVFLCFGSCGGDGGFSEAQMGQIEQALERSGKSFLWASKGRQDAGFRDRTRGSGVVVAGEWVPQAEVLGHVAVGAFVTHCGWNSVMEGILAGVPMICWPLYAEQRMNRTFVAEEAGVGVALKEEPGGLVTAGELEAKLMWLMDSDEGRTLRARAAALGQEARAALRHGGSAHADLKQMLASLLN